MSMLQYPKKTFSHISPAPDLGLNAFVVPLQNKYVFKKDIPINAWVP